MHKTSQLFSYKIVCVILLAILKVFLQGGKKCYFLIMPLVQSHETPLNPLLL